MPFYDRQVLCCLLLVFTAGIAASADEGDRRIDFNRDVRPILSDKCFHCHGPDPGTREAELRLDQEEAAKATVIVEGNVDDSELIRRVVSSDVDVVMPPPDSGKELTAEQIDILKRWVGDGAVWAKHWSFELPVKAKLPPISDAAWARNSIDHFVLHRLDQEKLKPSVEARRETLARRVAFDLTGLPPSGEQLHRYLSDQSPTAYDKLVDELLASKHYGERMAMVWLDAARYADSDGYQADATRQNWPWRDWVIDAYNNNMPFDRFTVEQFAGDLLKDATAEQILATCFHRNHMHNGEGGRDPEESRIEYVLDRVNTFGTVWMGLTLGCAQCHSHKYDPISQTEYYQLNAFFNSIDENGKAGGGAAPFLKFESPYVEAGTADSVSWLKASEKRLAQIRTEVRLDFDAWLTKQQTQIAAADGQHTSWKSSSAQQMRTTGGTTLTQEQDVFRVAGADPRHDDYLITIAPALPRITGIRLTVLPSPGADGRLSKYKDGHVILTNLKVRLRSADGTREREVALGDAVATYQAAKSGRIYGPVETVLDDDPRTGWMTTGSDASERKTAAFAVKEPLTLSAGESLVVELRQRSLRGYSNLQRFTLEFTDEVGPAANALEMTPLEKLAELGSATPKLREQLELQFLADQPRMLAAQEDVARAKRRLDQYNAAAKPQNITVLKQREKPRDSHVLIRGVWNNKGDKVSPAVPVSLCGDGKQPADRLELAQWLVSENNPLTARVTVNRYWQMYFGYGLVRTPDDFGTQGEPPTHPELLDWLAVEFMESGWDVKHLQRLIVTSATYRQTSEVDAELIQQDPQNRLLARVTRFRLPSWMIRDAALAASGLLSSRIGGPPVFSFQPEGAWLDATMGRFRYEPSVGSDLYRRSIYTFWRRSVGPTGMFDASKRRSCEVRSVRTNTPLQALTLMNDETFVEASRRLAELATRDIASSDEQIQWLARRVHQRDLVPEEAAVLGAQLAHHLEEYNADPKAAWQLISVGQTEAETDDPATVAALTMVAATILNSDEAMTHE